MMRRTMQAFAGFALSVSALAGSADAVPLDQWASQVVGFSSEYKPTPGNWSASRALGVPDTFSYGDIYSAWAPGSMNFTSEYLTLGFATPVHADGVTIRETYGNGFVTQVDVRDTGGALHTVWSGVDPSLPGSPVDFLATWAMTAYLVDAVKIYVNTSHNLNTWEEIDAVQLHGYTPLAPEPSVCLLAMAGVGLAALRRRRGRQSID